MGSGSTLGGRAPHSEREMMRGHLAAKAAEIFAEPKCIVGQIQRATTIAIFSGFPHSDLGRSIKHGVYIEYSDYWLVLVYLKYIKI